ncbi:MAG TPA: ATPase [Actinobacteria bacterium]|nr:ATPase [Actinomycetota bacterium]
MTAEEDLQLEDDFANLARLAAAGAQEDVRLWLAKLVRRYRTRHPSLAERLNETLKATHTRSTGSAALRRGVTPQFSPPEASLPVDADTRMSLLRVCDDRASGLEAPLLPNGLTTEIDGLIRERFEVDKLLAHGIRPPRSAILVGPPGVGKTLSARWIAFRLNKPLWVLDLTTVMSSLLGKTGANLRMVFDHAKANEAVLLLDEIDAIAKRRSDESDVGELKRLVTAILQEVDSWPDSGLLLAATNHPELIDPALWRRFDAIFQFPNADVTTVERGIRRFLGRDAGNFETYIGMLADALKGSSLSDVERSVTTLRRRVLLKEASPAEVVVSLVSPHIEELNKAHRQTLAVELAKSQAYSHNRIMELTGVSRDTIRKYAGPSPIKGRSGRKDA